MTTATNEIEIEIELQSANGPRVLYPANADIETVEAEVPDGWEVDWSNALQTHVRRFPAAGVEVIVWSAPLVKSPAPQAGTIEVETRVTNPRPTKTDVEDGIDYDVELAVTDEAGETYRWSGQVTYVPDPGRGGTLVPYGDTWDTWMSDELTGALRTSWIAAHDRLVSEIVTSLRGGVGDETFKVRL